MGLYKSIVSNSYTNDYYIVKWGTRFILRSNYELRFTLTAMPDYVGVPVKDAEAIPMFSIEWQTIFLYFCRRFQLKPHELGERTIRSF